MLHALATFAASLWVVGFIGSYFDLREQNRRYDAHDRAILEERRKRDEMDRA
jgi:hypothetical protein